MALNPLPADDLEQERQLVESAKGGQLDAMRAIFEKYSGPLYSAVILPKLGNATTAEEVLRDTLSTAIQKLETFQWSGTSIFAWLRQIAANKCYDVHRKNKRTRRLAEAVRQEAQTLALHHEGADTLIMAEQERSQSRVQIEAALGHMNPRYQHAIRLRLMQELSREDCAAQMDVSLSTFDVVFFRAVRSFRKQYGEPQP